MQKSLMLLICTALSFQTAFTQDFSSKYGKITDYELSMKSYANDTTAEAVVMYDDGFTSYDISSNQDFKVNLDIKQKIKILRTEGVDRATITLPYYFKSNGNRESINNLEAYSYNLENGKVVKTKLERKYIFDEELNNRYRQLKFSIPNVKVGSVIEFKYTKSSNDYYTIPDWYIQTNIPVIQSNYEVLIPEYFIFNKETKGYENIKVSETTDNKFFNINTSNGSQTITCPCRRIKFTANNVPALKDEPYVWCKNDFSSGVRFELSGTKFPNSFYKPYTQTWENLEETIKKETDFGSNLKMSNPFKDELKTLTDTIKDEKNKIQLIYSFIKNKIKWNELYSFYGNKAKEAIKNKTGDNGQINMILLSALKDAGISAYPVLISRRSQGRIPYTYPSFDQLSTFVVAAKTTTGENYYMDGSASYGGLNMLPVDLLVDRGRVFENSETEKWVDLTKIAKNQSIYLISSTLSKEGQISGTLKTKHNNQPAYSYKSTLYSAKDSTEFVEKQEINYNIKINNFIVTGKDTMSNSINEEIGFTKEIGQQGEYMYINPMLFKHIDKNPFIQSERKLPIEFNFPHSIQLYSQIEIPENYQIEELPKSVKITMPDNGGRCLYQIAQENNKIQLNYKFDLNQTIFPQTDYNIIKDFYAQVASKNGEMIVLKKIK